MVITQQPDVVGQEMLIPGDSALLSGSLFLPETVERCPAVVMLEVSGGLSYRRNWKPDAFPFWKQITEHLVAKGIAVLLFDKPGIHRSTGDWRKQSFQDRAADALCAVQFLHTIPQIDPSCIGLVGHSQGGWIAQLAAVHAPEQVHFIITLAGPAVTVKQQIIDDQHGDWMCNGAIAVSLRTAVLSAGLELLKLISTFATPSYLSRIIGYDPKSALERISQPTLALFGEHDKLVYRDSNIQRLKAHFGKILGNTNLFIHVIDSAEHGFRPASFCMKEELPKTFASGFFEALDDTRFWSLIR
jgi:uncharacterized protein